MSFKVEWKVWRDTDEKRASLLSILSKVHYIIQSTLEKNFYSLMRFIIF